ncbi:MAG: SDR family oxidoreductase [Pseudomonadota bacterium]
MTEPAPPPHLLVTGGSSGIGFATARIAVREGWSVSLIARDGGRLSEAAARLRRDQRIKRPQIAVFSADVSNRHDAERALTAATARFGAPEIALLCAGVARPGRFETLEPEHFEAAMRVNYLGSLWCARALAPAMTAAGRGALVFVSSGAGLIGLYGYTAYAPSKFAVRGLAESLRGELRPTGVSVSVVYPPDVDTPMLAAEEALKPVETKALSSAGGVLSADRVAASIWRGVARRRFTITPGWEMTGLQLGHSLLGRWIRIWSDRTTARARRRDPR